jgi:hypothetical protein
MRRLSVTRLRSDRSRGHHQNRDQQAGHQPGQDIGRNAFDLVGVVAPHRDRPGRAVERNPVRLIALLDGLVAAPHQDVDRAVPLALLQFGIGGGIR